MTINRGEPVLLHGERVTPTRCIAYDPFKKAYIWEVYNAKRDQTALAYEYELKEAE